MPKPLCLSYFTTMADFLKTSLEGTERMTELAKKKEWSGWDLNVGFLSIDVSLECNKDQLRRVLRSWVPLPPSPFLSAR